jgi:DNA-binding transcriptional LysR family regulator
MNLEQLPHLETFAKVAELSSFTAAGKELGLSQAAVSQRIQLLEQSLATPLFERKSSRVLLTAAGQRLYGYAQRILALHEEARREVSGQKPPVSGELTLAASSIPGEHLLPALLLAFRQKHPHIRVRATVLDTQTVLEQVERGRVQMGLVGGKKDNPHLEFRPFASDRLALFVAAEHPWGQRQRVSLAQLGQQPLILREPGSGSRWCLEQALARAGKSLHDMQVALELGSNEAIKVAVLRGLGVSILSSLAVTKELQSGQLHALRVSGLSLTRKLYAVWDRRRVLPISTRLFLDLLKASPGGAAHKRSL